MNFTKKNEYGYVQEVFNIAEEDDFNKRVNKAYQVCENLMPSQIHYNVTRKYDKFKKVFLFVFGLLLGAAICVLL